MLTPAEADYFTLNDRGRRAPKKVLVRSVDTWAHFGLEVWETAGESSPEIILPFDVITINEGIRTSEVHWAGSRPISGAKAKGMVGILPKDLPYRARAWAASRCTAVAIRHDMIESLAGASMPGGLELRPLYGFSDDFMQSCCSALVADARDGHPLGALYGESLSAALVAHLVRNYSNRSIQRDAESDRGALRRELIRQFIHDRLDEKLTLSDMASVVQMDMYSFAKWFRKTYGMPPHQYVLSARVEKAKGLLGASTDSLVTIALKCGFSSQSHFSSVFARAVGASPGEFRSRRH